MYLAALNYIVVADIESPQLMQIQQQFVRATNPSLTIVRDDGAPIYGREAIEKHWAEVFQKVHFSKHVSKPEQYSPSHDRYGWQ